MRFIPNNLKKIASIFLACAMVFACGPLPSDSAVGITAPGGIYETGSWTPTIGGTATYNSQTGNYIKIGNMVTVWGKLVIGIIGTGSTTTISGLPFVAANTQYMPGSAYFFNLPTTLVTVIPMVNINASTIGLYSASAATTGLALVPILDSSTTIYLTITYQAA